MDSSLVPAWARIVRRSLRSETVRLIPMLVKELTKRGYKFVTVSELINATRDQVMPPVTKSDTLNSSALMP